MARRGGRIHVVTNRRVGASGREYVSHLLRRTYREGGKVRNETVGNISHLPEELVELVRAWLGGERFLVSVDAFEVERSLPHGQVAGVLAIARQLELPRLLERERSPERQRALAMIYQRVLAPGSKLACSRALRQSTLAEVEKLRRRFGLRTVVLVIDRGMVTKANLELAKEEGMAWITALKAPQVKKLVKEGALQLSLFDQLNLAEVESPDYPQERLVVCRNPLVAQERARKREDLLQATEALLQPIKTRVEQGTLRGTAEIALAVGEVVNKRKVKKHFQLTIADERLAYRRKQEQIAEEAALDGFYVLRTNVPAEELTGPKVVRSYKALAHAERAFRTLKGPELELRPIHHRREQRVRAHAFLCMLAYYLEWHLRKAWAELLFDDEAPPVADDPVAKAERSPEAKRKASTQRTAASEVCHSFRSLIAELATVVRDTNRITDTEATFTKVTKANPTQARALELVGLDPERL